MMKKTFCNSSYNCFSSRFYIWLLKQRKPEQADYPGSCRGRKENTTEAAGNTTEQQPAKKLRPVQMLLPDKGGKTFGVTYWIESDFFKTVADSITSAAEADGNKTVVVDAQQDSTKQIQIIEDFIAQDVDAVFLNLVDRDAVALALQKLKEAGIPVINF